MQTLLHLTIFIIISLDITCLGSIPEYFLHDGGSGHCGQTIDSTQSVFVKSHDGAGLFDGLSSYTANQNCEVTYNAETGIYRLQLSPTPSTFFRQHVPLICVHALHPTVNNFVSAGPRKTSSLAVPRNCRKWLKTTTPPNIDSLFIGVMNSFSYGGFRPRTPVEMLIGVIFACFFWPPR